VVYINTAEALRKSTKKNKIWNTTCTSLCVGDFWLPVKDAIKVQLHTAVIIKCCWCSHWDDWEAVNWIL